jgi:hypothetical protein
MKITNYTIQLWGGVLLSAFSLIVGYYFGSSKGSSDKNEMMKK